MAHSSRDRIKELVSSADNSLIHFQEHLLSIHNIYITQAARNKERAIAAGQDLELYPPADYKDRDRVVEIMANLSEELRGILKSYRETMV